MQTKILTLAVSAERIKIHESILDFDPNNECECRLVTRSVRTSLGLWDYSLFYFIDGHSNYYLSKGRDFDELNSCLVVDLLNTKLTTTDYNKIKAALLKEIKAAFVPPNGENVFTLHYN